MASTDSAEGVLALDLGTSSVRAVIYDTAGRMIVPTLCDLRYKVQTREPGEVSSDPDGLVKLIAEAIDGALKAAPKKLSIIAVGTSCYWHSLMGIDAKGRPTTELFTWADTRSASETTRLRAEEDEGLYHSVTGCFFHASYWPAKLRWLRSTRAKAFRKAARWISLGEYLYQAFFGEPPAVSISIASGTGLLDVHRQDWDPNALRLAGIRANQLAQLSDWDRPCRGLRAALARRWPDLAKVPWYLPLGDGGLANLGAGAVTPDRMCATIGTSSAMRIIVAAERLEIQWGSFVYRLDRRRFVVGGALSEGGNVVRWLTDGLGLKHKKQLERAAGKIPPDRHRLTILPFWAGERSPNWRADARAVIAGLSLSTQPSDILRAAMEAISYQLAAVAESIERIAPKPAVVIATGGQLVHSPAWCQMLSDALNLPVMTSPEQEASSRGAALLALEAQGRFKKLSSIAPRPGHRYRPHKPTHAIYARARERQRRLYDLLFPAAGNTVPATPTAAPGSGSRRKDLRSPSARR
jgi:gluconokinase